LEVLVTTDLFQPGLFVPKWLHHTVLVAETNCTCLLVAKVVFLKHDAARTLNACFQAHTFLSCSECELFQRFQKTQQWEAYKHRLLHQLCSTGPVPGEQQ
jgi:hypothetical protein